MVFLEQGEGALVVDGDTLCSGALVEEAAADAGLREALLESALRQHAWPPSYVAEALRWLRSKGLDLGPKHARKAALLHGTSMTCGI